MKKAIRYAFLFFVAVTIHLTGMEPLSPETLAMLKDMPSIECMTQIECSLKTISPDDPRYKRHHVKKEIEKDQLNNEVFQGVSVNWCGYAAIPPVGTVSAVSGVWIVPTLSSSTINTYSSAWVGMDGYSNGTVEQIGTGHDWVNGAQDNYAWFEMFPNSMQEIIGFPVNNSDLIGAIVQYMGNNVFQLSLFNYTANVFTTIPTALTTSSTAQRTSAEWIAEAPSSSQGVLPLAHFGNILFGNCATVINGIYGPINSPYWFNDPIAMKANNIYKAVPSQLMNNNSFYATWLHE